MADTKKKKRKKSKRDRRLKLVSRYKKYVTSKGTTPPSLETFLSFSHLEFSEFKRHFKDLEELELAIILLYFKQADDSLKKDDEAQQWSTQDKHSAFLYTMLEYASRDTLFLASFVDEKRRSPAFMSRIAMALNGQSLHAFESVGGGLNIPGPIDINPKRSALAQHALTVLWFFAMDSSTEKQDTDAFVEKTTDLLFKLTDTSTLKSVFDLGKFLLIRKQAVFSWN